MSAATPRGWVADLLLEHAAEQLDTAPPDIGSPAPEVRTLPGYVDPQSWAEDGQAAHDRAVAGTVPERMHSPAKWLKLLFESVDGIGRVSSPSDSARFERPPGAKGRPATSTADTRAFDLVVPVDRAFRNAYTEPRDFGAVWLSIEEQETILELSIAGKPRQLPGYVKREEMSPEQIAVEVGERIDMPLTAKQVSIVRRAGMRAIGDALRELGLSPPARQQRRELLEQQHGAEPDDDLLTGWGEIADYLGRSLSSAQMLATRDVDPLPVVRTQDGVRASRAKVVQWIERGM